MATPFPADIEREILLRLPSKSLHRFTSVSKSWHSLITSPEFISSYNNHHSLHPKLLLLKHPFDPFTGLTLPHFSISQESSFNDHHPSNPFTLPPQHHDNLVPRRVELVTSNSINGIVCVLVQLGTPNGPVTDWAMYVWDLPSGKMLQIPPSDAHPMVRFYSGFGYDEGKNEYKVLRVSYLDSVNATVEVFSVKGFCWRKLNVANVLSNILWGDAACTFVDGVGYWGAFGSERKDRFFVLGFHFGSEGFNKIRLPEECVDGGELRYQSLWVYKGCLALSVLHFAGFDSNCTRQHIWVRKLQWSKLFVIDMEGAPRRPVASLTNGSVLLLGEGDGEHVVYDPQMEEVKRLDIFEVDSVVPYAESLVSLWNGTREVDGCSLKYECGKTRERT